MDAFKKTEDAFYWSQVRLARGALAPDIPKLTRLSVIEFSFTTATYTAILTPYPWEKSGTLQVRTDCPLTLPFFAAVRSIFLPLSHSRRRSPPPQKLRVHPLRDRNRC